MSYASNVKITYEFQPDIKPHVLAGIQHTAVEQHAGLERGADKETEIYLKSQEIEDILCSSNGYNLIVAFASSLETPDKEPVPVGYLLSTPHETRDDIEVVDDFYVVRRFKINGKNTFSKDLKIGSALHDEFIDTLPEEITEVHALPLEGSEGSYINRGYRGKPNSTFVKKLTK